MINEVDIANRALAKNHVLDDIQSADGLVANATTTGLGTTLIKRFFAGARQQIFRLAPWTCIQVRKQLAYRNRVASTAYLLGDLIVALHGSVYSVYKATAAGTSGSGAVTWPTSGTVVDGGVTWTFQYDVQGDIPAANFTGFTYGFPLPLDYVNQIDVTSGNGRRVEFEMEGTYLFCDVPDPILIYVPDESSPARWDPLLAEAIVSQLASAIAYPLTGSHENEIAFAQVAQSIVQQAAAKTMREKQSAQLPNAPWMDGLFNYPQQARPQSQQEQQ